MSWLGRGIGDFGSQVGAGYDINQQWRQRSQQMAMEQARQKLADLMGPLQLQELQQRIKTMQQPQAAGIEKLPGGGIGGVTFKDGVYSIQNLAPGAPPEPKFSSLQQAAAYYLQKGDLEKLKLVNDEIEKTRAQKAAASPKDAFELWQSQNPGKSVAEWLKLNEQFKKTGTEGGVKTPFELWKQQNPKGTYQQWADTSKQVDRGDATKAVTVAMNAFKNYQSIQSDALKNASHFNWLGKGKYSTDEAQSRVDAAKKDLDEKRQDAIQKLTDAGLSIPAWLQDQAGPVAPPTMPPPPGFVPNRTP
jgi:hypothetical protein